MIGERGGSTASLDAGAARLEQWKPVWSYRIKWRIVRRLLSVGRFHAEDLRDLNIPADHKNAIGAQVSGAVKAGWMVETGERRATKDATGHGRRSAVYAIGPDKWGLLQALLETRPPEPPAPADRVAPEQPTLFPVADRIGHLDGDR